MKWAINALLVAVVLAAQMVINMVTFHRQDRFTVKGVCICVELFNIDESADYKNIINERLI